MLKKLEGIQESKPERFEEFRREIVDKCIVSYPERFQNRARGLQFTLDCELGKQKNPLARMNRMAELFWGNFSEFQETLSNPKAKTEGNETSQPPAKVIPIS